MTGLFQKADLFFALYVKQDVGKYNLKVLFGLIVYSYLSLDLKLCLNTFKKVKLSNSASMPHTYGILWPLPV